MPDKRACGETDLIETEKRDSEAALATDDLEARASDSDTECAASTDALEAETEALYAFLVLVKYAALRLHLGMVSMKQFGTLTAYMIQVHGGIDPRVTTTSLGRVTSTSKSGPIAIPDC